MKKIELISKYLMNLDSKTKKKNLTFEPFINKKNLESIPTIGNVVLNKYLHIAQMIYLAFNQKKLFEEDIICFENGGVVLKVWKNWKKWKDDINFEQVKQELKKNYLKEKNFLDKFIKIFKEIELDQLIEISHYDKAWRDSVKDIYSKKTKNILKMKFYQEEYIELWKEWKNKFY